MQIAMIGSGAMGQTHAAAIGRIAGASVAAVVARTASPAANELARTCGAELLTLEQALARPQIDAVVIATPTDTHLELARAVAQAGKHILCEKPLARTLADGLAIIDAAAQAGVKLAVAQVLRYFPEYALARAAAQNGELGTPGVLRATRGGSFPTVGSGWYADQARSGGVALDLMIHDFDWARWTFGAVERVYAAGLTFAGRAGKDAAQVILRFRSGALGYVEGSWCYPSGFRTSFELAGSTGTLRHSSQRSAPLRYELAPREGGPAGVALPPGGLHDDPYLAQMRDFVGWLRGGPPPRCAPEDAFEALRISLAAIESMREGGPVTL